MNSRRFDLSSLLIFITACAGALALAVHSHRAGQQSGYDRGFDAAMEQRLSEGNIISIEYPIHEIIAKKYPNDSVERATPKLLKSIAETIKPETWDFVGGYGEMEVKQDEYNEPVLVVTNSIAVHLAVGRQFDDMRGAALGIRDRSLVKHLYKAQTEERR